MKKKIATVVTYATGFLSLFASLVGPRLSIGALALFFASLSFSFLAF